MKLLFSIGTVLALTGCGADRVQLKVPEGPRDVTVKFKVIPGNETLSIVPTSDLSNALGELGWRRMHLESCIFTIEENNAD